MSETFYCSDKESLIAFLYDEVDAPVRQRIEEHLRVCASCADEVEALSGVRAGLSSWAPPDAELGIMVVRKSADVVRPARRWTDVPAWARTAAAVLVLAIGAAIANVQVRSGPDGFVVTTGWMSPAGTVAPSAPAVPRLTEVEAREESWRPALAALESQLRSEIRASRERGPAFAVTAARTGDGDATLKQVQAMLADSEQRQRQELARRLTQLNRDIDVQRRADLVRLEQGFGQFEGRTGAEMARQRQMLNYVMRVSTPPQQ
jgi:hypothetical protein